MCLPIVDVDLCRFSTSWHTSVILDLIQCTTKHETEWIRTGKSRHLMIEAELSEWNKQRPVIVSSMQQLLDNTHDSSNGSLYFAVCTWIVGRYESMINACQSYQCSN